MIFYKNFDADNVMSMMKRSPDDQKADSDRNCDSTESNDLVYVNIYIPELQNEQTVICSKHESIWKLKIGIIERCNNLKSTDLNYGFFCASFGHFLDEELNLNHYFKEIIQKCCNRIRLELLYKQRIKVGEVMSTLPTASTTRRRRKRSRLMTAVSNGNIDKLAKILVNCDPNFVDESNGETPLSIASTCQSATTSAVQRVIIALVNGGALLDFRTKDGRTALHCAVQKSNYVALKTLLDLGASPNYLDASGLTPLCYTILHQSNPKLTQLLLHEHSIHGVSDQHGWQEVHHACKLGLVAHLEQLLYYGCDMNCRIVGSGNTPLHVSAINDQLDCARVLLLRGCDTSIVNNSHQNAYQVAVISGNMSLAELISNHKPEMVVPYRDKPKYNPARRATHSLDEQHPNKYETGQNQESKYRSQNGTSGTNTLQAHNQQLIPSSPSLSQRSCATSTTTTTTSSGVCCEDGSQSEGGDEDEDDESEDESLAKPVQLLPGMTVVAVADYNSGDPTHLPLRRNDMILLMQNNSSPPTIANQKLLLGRRCVDGKEGLFPTCCVEKIKLRVEGRRDQKYSSTTLPARGRSNTRGFLKSHQDSLSSGSSSSSVGLYHERTVTLHRGSKGFGFVLRGVKSTSPVLKLEQNLNPIGLQYLDEIEPSGVADAAGLKRGDFLLAVNGSDVRHMSHESVVQLIRKSGDKLTMTVATPIPQQKKHPVSILKKDGDKSSNKQINQKTGLNSGKADPDESQDSPDAQSLSQSLPSGRSLISSNLTQKFSTLPRNSPNSSTTSTTSRSTSRGRAPPAPPKRDPTTTLSIGRARARSLLLPNTSGQSGNQSSIRQEINSGNDYDSEGRSTKSSSPTTSIESMIVANQRNNNNNNGNKIASIRSRSSRRISSFELEEFFARQSDEMKSQIKTFDSMSALKKKKNSKLHKNFNSTPDLQKQLMDQMNKKRCNNLSNSEEELFYNHGIYAETLPLRGGKFIPTSELSTNFDDKSSSQIPSRAPPPSYPPPPPPSGLQTSVIKVTLAKHQQSDYANFESVSQNQQMLSSFRPPVQTTAESQPESNVQTISVVPKAPAPPPGSQSKSGTLKPVRHPSTGSTTASLYTRQETIESLDQQLSTPHIPEPDYSTSEDEDININRDLSTFRASNTTTTTSATITSSASSVPTRMTQSFAENLPKTTSSSSSAPKSYSTLDRKKQLVSAEELKAQSEKIMSKSMTAHESVPESKKQLKLNEEKVIDESNENDMSCDSVSKVRKNIREFERRSSVCEPVVTVVPNAMSVSMKKEVNTNSANQMRTSKSCFEVDFCDNSSSGVSSDVDGEYAANALMATNCGSKQQQTQQSQQSQQIQTLNRRNSAIVSEKIANLMAMSGPTVANKPSNASISQTIVQKPVAVLPQQQFLHQNRRTSSMSEDNQNNTIKVSQSGSSSMTTSVPTSGSSNETIIRSNSGSANVPNMGQNNAMPLNSTKTVTFSLTQLKSEPKPIATKLLPKNTGSDSSAPKTSTATAIRLQIDSLGLAAVNEVDVLAELVPPPPEFAAPPPGLTSVQTVNKDQRVGQTQPQSQPQPQQALQAQQPMQTQQHIHQTQQQLTQQQIQQRQQQMQQIRQQQLLQQQMQQQRRLRQQSPSPSTQPPPIPLQPPPQTLPHQHHLHQHYGQQQQQREQIRILSPTPHQVVGHQNPQQLQQQQHYHRIHQQAIESSRPSATGTPPPPPAQFSDPLMQQKYEQKLQQLNKQHIEQQISAAMRLGVSEQQLNSIRLQNNAKLGQQSGQQYAQQFGTLRRVTPTAGMTSSQECAFATMSRHQQQQHLQQRHNYSDYTKLTVQNRLMRRETSSPQPIQPPTHQPVFCRKAVIEWTSDDVQEWLKCIGMAEHSVKFEFFNGAKLLRLDNNALLGCGIRQQQHRIYLLDKLKQQIWQNHQ